MKPTRAASRRSFLRTVTGAILGGGALFAVTGAAAGAGQISDRDSGAGADLAGQGRGQPAEPGDSDFARPYLTGDVMNSDLAPGRRSGVTDSDDGPAADFVGYGAGRNRQAAHAARCAGLRQRLTRQRTTRPRTAEVEERIEAMTPYLERWRCR